ncbi:conserved protein of unknown function [Kyrpidia spormannii]|uniref:Uncharacterized protein n=2 Tax=Kyrpidia spormannii TaxID=2055160 RepID=A0ACA8ZAE3_9BACL|nr:conserved protein of unknown function [Kyrpidia spormannii]CAB3394354.1 conserved protein of unknown function [Kyrpidia spormannii]
MAKQLTSVWESAKSNERLPVVLLSRLIDRPVAVRVKKGLPDSFSFRGQSHQILEIIDQWEESGAWWKGEPSYRIYRVQTADLGVFDLKRYKEEWRLYRIWD